jgi:hypothetical protein
MSIFPARYIRALQATAGLQSAAKRVWLASKYTDGMLFLEIKRLTPLAANA